MKIELTDTRVRGIVVKGQLRCSSTDLKSPFDLYIVVVT
jgi:hypothetical protein